MLKPITTGIVSLTLITSALTAVSAEPKGKIARAVAGKLVKAEGSKVKPYTINASPKYYVLYHSASW